MSLQYVSETDASLNEGSVADSVSTPLAEGEFVVQESDGDFVRFDPANDALPHGIIVHHPGPTSDALVQHDEKYVPYEDLWQYASGEDFYYQPLSSVDTIQGRSLTDNDTDPAPSFSEGEIVGIVTINTETRIVQSGYTDNSGTPYSETGAGDFVALGRVDHYPMELRISDGFDQRVPVRLDADLYTA